MGILSWLVFGALAGWIASLIAKTDEEQGIIANIVVGVLGAIIGGGVFSMLGGEDVTGFNVYSIMVAVVGAVILLTILKFLRK